MGQNHSYEKIEMTEKEMTEKEIEIENKMNEFRNVRKNINNTKFKKCIAYDFKDKKYSIYIPLDNHSSIDFNRKFDSAYDAEKCIIKLINKIDILISETD
jgi:hypothetical protein